MTGVQTCALPISLQIPSQYPLGLHDLLGHLIAVLPQLLHRLKDFGIQQVAADILHLADLTTVQMFIRAILGKYTIETMVPVMLALLISFGAVGIVGTGIIAALALAQLILLFANRNACVIHDLLAGTVVVDLPSQGCSIPRRSCWPIRSRPQPSVPPGSRTEVNDLSVF